MILKADTDIKEQTMKEINRSISLIFFCLPTFYLLEEPLPPVTLIFFGVAIVISLVIGESYNQLLMFFGDNSFKPWLTLVKYIYGGSFLGIVFVVMLQAIIPSVLG
jgi:hypothetical protein